MMRETHPVFDRDIDPDAPVWRYFDFAKFVALLQTRSLYFSRADLLGDPLEGSFTQAYAAQREAMLADPPEGRTRDELAKVFRHNERIFAQMPRACYVNCWHLGDHESMAMWRGYGGGAYGVAIRSTFERLDTAIPESLDFESHQEQIYIGKIHYIDYTSLTTNLPHAFNVYGRLMCKSLAYRHENEVRAIFINPAAGFFGIRTAVWSRRLRRA